REVENQAQNLARKIPGLQDALDKPGPNQAPAFVYGQSNEWRNALIQSRHTTHALADETAQRATELRERLGRQQNPALAALDQARSLADRAANQKRDKSNTEPAKDQAADKLAAAARQM